ncbi:uncharacterized protein, partial [Amphiura filiformis]|uniref:uncharacterized protein n=1 Tax=Amphiura filiformis TaxID=82378 RepID=UPI003B21F124
ITNGDAEVVKRQTTGKIVTLTKAEKDAILNKHNELRGQVSPSAEDMEYMYWDDNEANAAEQWAAACRRGHDRSNQNQYAAGGTLKLPQGGVDATNKWYNEYQNYTYDSNSCKGMCFQYFHSVPNQVRSYCFFSDCPNKCQHGGTLNANECTCSCQNGWFGISCQRECTDEIGYYYCDPFYNIYCDSSPDLVAKHCPAMCGDCE